MWPLIYYPRLLTWRKTLSTWHSIWPLTSLSHGLMTSFSQPLISFDTSPFSRNIQNFCHSSHDDSHTSFRMTYLTSPSRLLTVYCTYMTYDLILTTCTVIGDLWSFAHDLLHDPFWMIYDLCPVWPKARRTVWPPWTEGMKVTELNVTLPSGLVWKYSWLSSKHN